jgi:hypothetical protein
MYCNGLDIASVSGFNHLLLPEIGLAGVSSRGNKQGSWRAMNGLLWIAQIILAGVFLFTGFSKLFTYEKLVKLLRADQRAG